MLKVNNLNFSYSKNNEDTLKDISFELITIRYMLF